MSDSKKKLVLAVLFIIGTALLFVPVRLDHVTGYYEGEDPVTRILQPADDYYYSAVLLGFNGHPVGIAGIILFALMPFLVVWQSFSITRPFSLPARAFLQLQATLMFIGGPYAWYMITYQHGYFSHAEHDTTAAWGGWMLIGYLIICGALLFSVIAAPEGKLAKQLFMFQKKDN